VATTDLTIILNAKDEASKVMKGTVGNFQQYGKQIGGAMAGAGAAGLKFAGDSKDLTGQLNVTAMGLDVNTDELRKLMLETANVTFSVEETTTTFDTLTRAGMKDAKQMAKSATAFDTLGDAIGKPASQVAKTLVPAFKAFGIGLEDAGDHTDAFTWLTRNTTVELDDFSSAMNYLAPDIDTLGLSLDDTVAIMAALEAKGISGSAATKEFRTAVTAAATGEQSLTDALGLTDAELAIYQTEIAGSTGLTDQYAEAANAQYGTVDKLKHSFSELSVKLGAQLEPLEGVFAGMTALGPVVMLASTSVGANTFKLIGNTAAFVAQKTAMAAGKIIMVGVTAAQWLLNAAMTANPIGLVVLAVVALIAIGLALWKYWDEIVAFFGVAWDTIKLVFTNTIDAIGKLVTTAFGAIFDFLKEWGLFVVGIIFPPALIAGVIVKWGDTIWEKISEVFDDVKGLFVGAKDFVIEKWEGLVDWFKELPGKIGDALSTVKDTITEPFKAAKDLASEKWEDLLGWFKELPGKIGDALATVKDAITEPFKIAINAATGLFNSMLSAISGIQLFRLEKTFKVPVIGTKIKVDWAVNLPSIGWRIPELDSGGIVTGPTLAALAMNRKPEAIIPLDKLGGVGGGNAVININLDGQQIASYTVDLLSEEVKLQGIGY